jgi:hypothetical protein
MSSPAAGKAMNNLTVQALMITNVKDFSILLCSALLLSKDISPAIALALLNQRMLLTYWYK